MILKGGNNRVRGDRGDSDGSTVLCSGGWQTVEEEMESNACR